MASQSADQDLLDALEREVEWRFIHGTGPGGQNVNKVATAVQLRFDVARTALLDAAGRSRLEALAGRRLTADGTLILLARAHRSQDRNRADALDRLATLIVAARTLQRPRRATRPTLASKKRRLEAKTQRGAIKSQRRVGPIDDR